MTLAAVMDDEVVAEITAEVPVAVSVRVSRPFQLRPLVTALLLALLAVAAVTALFEFPVAGIWYRARQAQLASDFATPSRTLRPGHAAAQLQIPAVDVDLYVVQGVEPDQLRTGPGHVPGTPLPGHRGNSLVLGHAQGWGSPFGDLEKLKRKDHIYIRTRNHPPLLFSVTSVVHLRDGDVRQARRLFSRTDDFRLTLVTGDGGVLSQSGDRLVVVAVSGTQGERRSGSQVSPTVPTGSWALNRETALGLLAFGLALVLMVATYRRYRRGAVIVVATPLLVAGLVALLLDLDRVLAALR